MTKLREILEIVDPIERLKKLSEISGKEIELLNMQAKILSQAKEEMSEPAGILSARADEGDTHRTW